MFKGKVVYKKHFVYEGDIKEKQRLYERGIGILIKDELFLDQREALLLNDIYNVEITKEAFNKIKNISSYIAFRELFMKGYKFIDKKGNTNEIKGQEKPLKIYKKANVNYSLKEKAEVIIFNSQFVMIKGSAELYNNYWFGQLGAYKKHYGKIFLLDFYEAMYLKERNLLLNFKLDKVKSKFFDEIYSVYKEWRDAGYVLKTGFKFGGDFRVYEPFATPLKKLHSKHVLQVFPKGLNIDAEHWSKGIRVCHGVRKTYILALPKNEITKKTESLENFKHDGIVKKDNEIYVLKVLKQQERINGNMLFSALNFCISKQLPLLLCIVDREGAATFYKAEQILLEKDNKKENMGNFENLYYEISWLNI
jgi:tRNA-intron endonuclease